MCGIGGELRFDGGGGDLAALGRMLECLKRRGPDHEGCFSDGPVALGHRRLAIIDLSEKSNQPLVDSDLGLVLVFNGTIYNYPELRSELIRLGYHFFSHGDSEVILKAFHAWGEHCVERLTGMFAFAIWDLHQHQLFLARDRLGIKPLYYASGPRWFRFASNTQALLAAGDIDCTIDPVALHHQLTLHAVIPAPRTILNGVRKVAPGTTLTVTDRGEIRERRYWRLRAERPPEPREEKEWIEAIHQALTRAVERRLTIADVPVGVLLSGGLDSSLLVGLLAEAGVEDLLTFSVGFEDQPEEKGSEFEYSDQVVERFATRHHKFLIPNENVLERLPEAVDQMAEPMVGQDAVAFYLLAERVSREVKVVQSGQGADEVFGGYHWYPPLLESRDPLGDYARHFFDRDHAEYARCVQAPWVGEDYSRQFVAGHFAQPGASSGIDKALRLDTTVMLVDDPVKRVDNMTMAWGLEARVPFLDHELVELAARIPAEHKIREGGKYVLKEAARQVIPAAVIDRPKGYFPVPALKYIRGAYLDFVRDILLQPRARQRGVFDNAYVDTLLAEPQAHITPLRGSKLWQIALLELWLQQRGL